MGAEGNDARVSGAERRVLAAVDAARERLVELTAQLVTFDTTSRSADEPPREEEAMQRFLERRMAALGAVTDLWEPEPTTPEDRFVEAGIRFAGRPQLAARLAGCGDGRSILLNGHIDAVSYEPREKWSGHPLQLRRECSDGAPGRPDGSPRGPRLIGRGAADMKSGIAAICIALEILREENVHLAGDIVFCTVTDEESSAAGSWSAVKHGVRADAGICAEPTGFEAWSACRGGTTATVVIPGRAGHADLPQPDWREGGAVNAIEKQVLVLDAVRRLREEWARRATHRHSLLAPPDMVPTIVQGGDWEVTYPASCAVTAEITYLPVQADPDGGASLVRREVEDFIGDAVKTDSWLAQEGLAWSWAGDVAPAEIPKDHPLVRMALEAAQSRGHAGRVAGLQSWHDAANFTRFGGTPCFSFGPGPCTTAHTVDEWVDEDDLVDFTAALALTIMRWCGVA